MAERIALTVLGSAAGGGLPQWNCRCQVCRLAWAGDPRVKPRTQSSIGLRNAAGRWVLLNASPDVRQQIAQRAALQPRGALRDSPIAAIVLTNADVDHIAGLLSLRERWPLAVFAPARVLAALEANPVFEVLARDVAARNAIAVDVPFVPIEGVMLTLFSVPGKVPLWSEGAWSEGAGEGGLAGAATVETAIDDGRTVGVAIGDPARPDAFYIPGCAAMTPGLAARLGDAPLVLFDGTLFDDDEMRRAGLGSKTARRMGHMPVSGQGGSLEAFAALGVRRKVFTHINNSNPMLIEGSPEHAAVTAHGWEVAEDGMEIAL